MSPLTPAEIDEWLRIHVPYRIRAGIAGTELWDDFDPRPFFISPQDGTKWWCIQHGLHQGRLVAVRWLIEFVGIKWEKGKPAESNAVSKNPGTDFGINRLPGGRPFSRNLPEAQLLADTWKGCSQAIAHPTRGTGHPDVEAPTLTKVMRIIIPHLEATIYAHAGLTVRAVL